jgi:hypothetical protein
VHALSPEPIYSHGPGHLGSDDLQVFGRVIEILAEKLPSAPEFQSDGSFFDRYFRFTNYRQKHRQKFLLPRMHFRGSEGVLCKINDL